MAKTNFYNKKLAYLTAFTLFFLVVFVKLGFWQITRADEKEALYKDIYSNKQIYQNIQDINQLKSLKNYNKVKLSGHFDFDHSFVIPDQIYNHKLGSNIITPFILNKKNNELKNNSLNIVLINRGFIDNNKNNNQNLIEHITEQQYIVKGMLLAPKSKFILGNNLLSNEKDIYPLKIQYIDINLINNLFTTNLHNKFNLNNQILLLDDIELQDNIKEQILFEKNWNFINTTPEKHIGYAIQWFIKVILFWQ
tara:strand:- start:2934 stop:3686 length:753 start_codon:yes stop_codon:yes gene_type:complete